MLQPDLQVSTLCVRGDLVATGGFGGELVVKRLGHPGWVYANRISNRCVCRAAVGGRVHHSVCALCVCTGWALGSQAALPTGCVAPRSVVLGSKRLHGLFWSSVECTHWQCALWCSWWRWWWWLRSENGITNGLEICDLPGRAPCIMAASNDSLIRVFEVGQEFK